jgi:predicted Zn-dependent protease
LLAIDGVPVAKRPELATSPLRDSAFAALAEHDLSKPLRLGIVQAGAARSVEIPVAPECRAMVEILDENDTTARSDGGTIQIGYGLASRATDEQLAVVFAHELAHSILHHRERLEAAGARIGVLGQVGRDRRLNLRAEEDADRLSVYLLANAGIDPHAAPAFWRSKFGRRLSGGIFHNLAHPSAKARAQMMEAEIAAHSHAGALAYPAELLATRTQPLE